MKRENQKKRLILDHFIQCLKEHSNYLKEFDDRLWGAAIEKVIIQPDQKIVFIFKDGLNITSPK